MTQRCWVSIATTKLSSFRPNAEAVASYNPDLVVTSAAGAVVAQLQKIGITVLVEAAPANLAEAYDEIRQLGLATGETVDGDRQPGPENEDTELFPVQSWLYVLLGQNIVPSGYDPMADILDAQEVQTTLDDIRAVVRKCADAMPLHQDFISQNCAASTTSA